MKKIAQSAEDLADMLLLAKSAVELPGWLQGIVDSVKAGGSDALAYVNSLPPAVRNAVYGAVGGGAIGAAAPEPEDEFGNRRSRLYNMLRGSVLGGAALGGGTALWEGYQGGLANTKATTDKLQAEAARTAREAAMAANQTRIDAAEAKGVPTTAAGAAATIPAALGKVFLPPSLPYTPEEILKHWETSGARLPPGKTTPAEFAQEAAGRLKHEYAVDKGNYDARMESMGAGAGLGAVSGAMQALGKRTGDLQRLRKGRMTLQELLGDPNDLNGQLSVPADGKKLRGADALRQILGGGKVDFGKVPDTPGRFPQLDVDRVVEQWQDTATRTPALGAGSTAAGVHPMRMPNTPLGADPAHNFAGKKPVGLQVDQLTSLYRHSPKRPSVVRRGLLGAGLGMGIGGVASWARQDTPLTRLGDAAAKATPPVLDQRDPLARPGAAGPLSPDRRAAPLPD